MVKIRKHSDLKSILLLEWRNESSIHNFVSFIFLELLALKMIQSIHIKSKK